MEEGASMESREYRLFPERSTQSSEGEDATSQRCHEAEETMKMQST